MLEIKLIKGIRPLVLLLSFVFAHASRSGHENYRAIGLNLKWGLLNDLLLLEIIKRIYLRLVGWLRVRILWVGAVYQLPCTILLVNRTLFLSLLPDHFSSPKNWWLNVNLLRISLTIGSNAYLLTAFLRDDALTDHSLYDVRDFFELIWPNNRAWPALALRITVVKRWARFTE